MQQYEHDDGMNPVKANGITTAYASGIIVLGALLFLILIKRGFRGVSVGGVSVGVK